MTNCNNNPATCCILGLGYIGLPTAAILADSGVKVIGVDVDKVVIETVNKGLAHIVEPGLGQVVKNAVSSGWLTAQSSPAQADIYVIAVPTPFYSNSDRIPRPNLEFVLSAAKSICSYLQPGNLIVLESTSPVGTTDLLSQLILEQSGLGDDELHIAYCPERVLPGRILHELVYNDRVVGGRTPAATSRAASFYSRFCKGKILPTSARTAELVKLTENSFRDINIAFANELSIICERFGVSDRELISLANHHPRVNILQPGCGVGGHCIAVDPWFLASALPDCTPLIQAARNVNDYKSQWVTDKISEKALSLSNDLGRPAKVGCLGLSFKPDVDDLRESPAVMIVLSLMSQGYDVIACEPNIAEHPSIHISDLDFVIASSDLIVILVAHEAFKRLDLSRLNYIDFCGATQRLTPST